MALALILLTSPSFAKDSSQIGGSGYQKICAQPIALYCRGRSPNCLLSAKEAHLKLEKNCADYVFEHSNFQKACSAEIKTNCSPIKNNHALVKCLRAFEPDISSAACLKSIW